MRATVIISNYDTVFIPDNICYLNFYNGGSNNFKLKPGDIPSSVRVLDFNGSYGGYYGPVIPSVIPSVIPNSVTALKFNYRNKNIVPGSIPNSVIILDCGPKLDTFNTNVIPDSVTTLLLTTRELIGVIPNSVTDLQLDAPNILPGVITTSVVSLSLTNTNIIQNVIPPSVTALSLKTDNLTPGIIPNGVIRLKLIDWENPIVGSIPDSVKYLDLSNNFNHPIIPGLIPSNLKALHLAYLDIQCSLSTKKLYITGVYLSNEIFLVHFTNQLRYLFDSDKLQNVSKIYVQGDLRRYRSLDLIFKNKLIESPKSRKIRFHIGDTKIKGC